jgi:hypothetical protein
MTAEKSGIVECVDVAIARQRHAEHMSMTTDVYATIEKLLEVVFSM